MRKRVIALMGRAGSGKSTLGKRIAEELGYKYLSTGDLARTLSDLDWQAKGQFAPEDQVRAMVTKAIAEATEPVVILDGMPRMADQVYFLMDLYDVSFICVVVDEEVARARLMERGRTDDTDRAIEERLATYRRNAPAIMTTLEGATFSGLIDPPRFVYSECNVELTYHFFKHAVLRLING